MTRVRTFSDPSLADLAAATGLAELLGLGGLERKDYAPRISQQQWQCHEGTVKYLHKQGKTRKEIIDYLLEAYAFHPSLAQLNAQMRRWELKVYGKIDPVTREADDAMALSDLPEGQNLHGFNLLLPTGSVQALSALQPDTTYSHSQLGVDQNAVDVLQVGCTQKIPTAIMHEVHFANATTSSVENDLQHASETSMIKFSTEPPEVMSVCDHSSTSHGTRSTFATHHSDTSSLREFRSTAARAYEASKICNEPTEVKKTHKDDIASVQNSWLFMMADAGTFLKAYEIFLRTAMVIGRDREFGCACRSQGSMWTPSVQDPQILEGLLEELSCFQSRDWLKTAMENISSQKEAHQAESLLSGDSGLDFLITEFDEFFVRHGCAECMIKTLDRLGEVSRHELEHPSCSYCALPANDSATGRTVSGELAMVFGMFCQQVELRSNLGSTLLWPDIKDELAQQLQELQAMYELMKSLRSQLLRAHDLDSEGYVDAQAPVRL